MSTFLHVMCGSSGNVNRALNEIFACRHIKIATYVDIIEHVYIEMNSK